MIHRYSVEFLKWIRRGRYMVNTATDDKLTLKQWKKKQQEAKGQWCRITDIPKSI